MCGGVIVADPEDPAEAVLTHIRGLRHRTARGRAMLRRCEHCRMVTIPAWRQLCHYCVRTIQAEEAAAA